MRASRRSSETYARRTRVRETSPVSRLPSPCSHPMPFVSCVSTPSPHSLILTHEEWFPFVCPVGPTPAHVYRRRESDTFARMLQARESSEKKKGLLLNEILPNSNSTVALFFSLYLDRFFLVYFIKTFNKSLS